MCAFRATSISQNPVAKFMLHLRWPFMFKVEKVVWSIGTSTFSLSEPPFMHSRAVRSEPELRSAHQDQSVCVQRSLMNFWNLAGISLRYSTVPPGSMLNEWGMEYTIWWFLPSSYTVCTLTLKSVSSLSILLLETGAKYRLLTIWYVWNN